MLYCDKSTSSIICYTRTAHTEHLANWLLPLCCSFLCTFSSSRLHMPPLTFDRCFDVSIAASAIDMSIASIGRATNSFYAIYADNLENVRIAWIWDLLLLLLFELYTSVNAFVSCYLFRAPVTYEVLVQRTTHSFFEFRICEWHRRRARKSNFLCHR